MASQSLKYLFDENCDDDHSSITVLNKDESKQEADKHFELMLLMCCFSFDDSAETET